MDEIKQNDYMNGGGLFDFFSSANKKTSDMISKEMEELLSNEIEQLKKYLVVPGELNKFFKNIYLKDTIGLMSTPVSKPGSNKKQTLKPEPTIKPTVDPINREKIGEIHTKLKQFIFDNINNNINYDSYELPDVIEIPRKKYKKDQEFQIKIESIKISKKDLLMHLVNFKIDLDEYHEHIIKNIDKLKEKMLGNRLINLDNLTYFMLQLYITVDCKNIEDKIQFIKTNGLDAFNKKVNNLSQQSNVTNVTLDFNTSKTAKDTCMHCNILINTINDIHNFINNIINELKTQLLDDNQIIKHFFYDYLMDKLYNKSSSPLISFIKSSYKQLLIHFLYNIYRNFFQLDISEEYSYKINNNIILAVCTIYVNTIYDYLNQPAYLKKVLSLMNPNNYHTFCVKTIFNLFINIETTAQNSISKLFVNNQLLTSRDYLVNSPIRNYDFINTIYINGSTNYIDRINESLGKYTESSKYKLCKINYVTNFILSSLYTKLEYNDTKKKINPPIHLTENLFLLVDIGLTLYNIKTREIKKEQVDSTNYIQSLECNLFTNSKPPPYSEA